MNDLNIAGGKIMIKKYTILLMIITSSLLYGGELKEAVFAGGCFWSMEKSFEKIEGVETVISGYVGDSIPDPNDKNYGKGEDIEVIQITYDPSIISYEKLLKVYWKQIDPTDGGGQFVDRGHEYTTAIFYSDSEQKQAAISSKMDLETRGVYKKSIVTPILEVAKFYPAKKYHQDYSKRNPLKYKYSRNKSGRDKFLDEIWGKDRKDIGVRELKNKLTDL